MDRLPTLDHDRLLTEGPIEIHKDRYVCLPSAGGIG